MMPFDNELTALRTYPIEGPPPRYEAGWMLNYEDGAFVGYVAFLRPYHEGWYDLFRFRNWWEALAKAIDIATNTRDCEFVGGPPIGGDL